MKTPINEQTFFSIRYEKHPIDGFNKIHRGTDFADLWEHNYISGWCYKKLVGAVEVEIVLK